MSRYFKILACAGVFSVAGLCCSGVVSAQEKVKTFGTIDSVANLSPDELPAEVKILQSIEKEIKAKYKKQIYVRSQVPSLFFTSSQHALLREARVGFNTRVPTLQDLHDAGDPNDPNYRPPVSLRELALAGILYNSDQDWIVYLNKTRITPDAIPSEIVDIKVFKDYIELRWFDQISNQIFPVRLRPNQRFNLDARVFLPGQSS
ncbi:MAG: hypothetical protein KDJ26_02335 [Alphaproteobacteria bacterium]|nr:hypothetical protein [Alphaproteobacteria bacterium]MCB1550820.1 hypothetical protein [Alphaproteobacteria bacterium]MCB9985104.1 hypothetical protein [Micavibrio sp.]HRK97485.1 hypothetical protein [Alphaproteobacteria bacterium]